MPDTLITLPMIMETLERAFAAAAVAEEQQMQKQIEYFKSPQFKADREEFKRIMEASHG